MKKAAQCLKISADFLFFLNSGVSFHFFLFLVSLFHHLVSCLVIVCYSKHSNS